MRGAVLGTIPDFAGRHSHGLSREILDPIEIRAPRNFILHSFAINLHKLATTDLMDQEHLIESHRSEVRHNSIQWNVFTTALAPPELCGSIAMFNKRLSFVIALGESTTFVIPFNCRFSAQFLKFAGNGSKENNFYGQASAWPGK